MPSLVGSEMCIRDRRDLLPQLWPPAEAVRPGQLRGQEGAAPGPAAVLLLHGEEALSLIHI